LKGKQCRFINSQPDEALHQHHFFVPVFILAGDLVARTLNEENEMRAKMFPILDWFAGEYRGDPIRRGFCPSCGARRMADYAFSRPELRNWREIQMDLARIQS